MTLRTAAAVGAILGMLALPGCDRGGPAPDAPDTSWRITYRTEATTIDVVTVEVVEVQRPYRARTVVREADGETLVTGTIWTESGLFLLDGTGLITQVQAIAPGRPGPDVRLDVTLPDALAQGELEPPTPSEVAGRACDEYVTRGPLDANLPEPPTVDESTRSCVDSQGRVLRDEWTLDGTVIRRRAATSVEVGVVLDDAALFGEVDVAPVPDALILTDIRLLEVATETATLAFAFPDTVDGLPRDLLVEIRDLPGPVGGAGSTLLTWRATYTDGSRLVIIEQSRTLAGPTPPLPPGAPFALAPLLDAVVAPSFDGLAVTGTVGDVRVEIRGPLPRATLATLELVAEDDG